MSISQIQIALDLDEDASPAFLDGKLRIVAEDGQVTFFVQKERSGQDYIRADCSKEELLRALGLLGILP